VQGGDVTISGIYSQSLSFTLAYTSSRDAGPKGATTPASSAATGTADRVNLSPQAARPPDEQPAAVSGGSSRADALFAALDGDHDGSVTEQEFSKAAAALLRQARGHGRHHHAHGPDEGQAVEQGGHVPPGLEKRMGRVFSQVDANHDGALDPGELTAAFAQQGGRGADQPATTPGATDQPSTSVANPTAAATTRLVTLSVTQVTTVSFALQRYAVVDQATGAGASGSLNAAA
jgi:EF hand